MRVICIDDKPKGPPQGPWMIKEGEIYEVISSNVHPDWGEYYQLSIQPGVGYWATYFIPLSSIDETTFEREYNKEKV